MFRCLGVNEFNYSSLSKFSIIRIRILYRSPHLSTLSLNLPYAGRWKNKRSPRQRKNLSRLGTHLPGPDGIRICGSEVFNLLKTDFYRGRSAGSDNFARVLLGHGHRSGRFRGTDRNTFILQISKNRKANLQSGLQAIRCAD